MDSLATASCIVKCASAALDLFDFTTQITTGSWPENGQRTGDTAGDVDWEVPRLTFTTVHDASDRLKQIIRSLMSMQHIPVDALSEADARFFDIKIACLSAASTLYGPMPDLFVKVDERSWTSLWQALVEELGSAKAHSICEDLSKQQPNFLSVTIQSLWEKAKQTDDALGEICKHVTSLYRRIHCRSRIQLQRQSREAAVDMLLESRVFLEKIDWEGESLRHVRQEILDGLRNMDEPTTHKPNNSPRPASQQCKSLADHIIQSLSLPTTEPRHYYIPPDVRSSLAWIWREPKPPLASSWSSFPAWLEGSLTKPYLFVGKSGSGKSSLMSYIEEQPELHNRLSRWQPSLPLKIVSLDVRDSEKTVDGLVRILLSQILKEKPEFISLVLRRRWAFETTLLGSRYPPEWEIEDMTRLEECLHRCLSGAQAHMKFLIVIDGIDKLRIPPDKLVQIIESISTHENVKLCLTCRPRLQTMTDSRAYPQLEIRHLTEEHMEQRILRILRSCETIEDPLKHLDRLIKDISWRSGGVFFWADIVARAVLGMLLQGYSLEDLTSMVVQLPHDPSDLYSAIWNWISPEQRLDAAEIFGLLKIGPLRRLHFLTLWVAVERRSTKLDLPRHTAKNPERVRAIVERLLRRRTLGLLEVDTTGFVTYSQKSIRKWAAAEGLLGNQDNSWRYDLFLLEGLCAWGLHIPLKHECGSPPGRWLYWQEHLQMSVIHHTSKIAAIHSLDNETTDSVVTWLEDFGRDLEVSGSLAWFGDWKYHLSNEHSIKIEVRRFVDVMAMCGFGPFVKKHLQRNQGSLSSSLFFLSIYCPTSFETERVYESPNPPLDSRLGLLRLCLKHGATPGRFWPRHNQATYLRILPCSLEDVVVDVRERCNHITSDYERKKYYKQVADIVEDWMTGNSKIATMEPPIALQELNLSVDSPAFRNSGNLDPSLLSKSTATSRSIWSRQQASTKPSSVSDEAPLNDTLPSSSTFAEHWEVAEEDKEFQDDIQSLASIAGDTASTLNSSPVTTRQQRAAVNYLVQVLTEDEELSSMYELAFRKMDFERFKRNHRKLLRSFASDLSTQETISPAQSQTISFLRRWNTRTQLSAAIFGIIMPTGSTDLERVNRLVSQERDSLFSITRFLEATDAPDQPLPLIEDQLNVFPAVEDKANVGHDTQEVEGEVSNSNSEGDFDDVDERFEHMLSKLEATREFLCAGQAFIRYKANLRQFLQPDRGRLEPELPISSQSTPEKSTTALEEPTSDYDVSFTRSIWPTMVDSCKRGLELAAGTELSWWPLADPERDLKPGYTRVYSMAFTRNRRFYDDVPIFLADSLFPKLPIARVAAASKPIWAALGQDAVYLRDSTPLHHLRRRDDRHGEGICSGSSAEDGGYSLEGVDSLPSTLRVATQTSQQASGDNGPIIFLSGDIGRNESVALAVNVGEDDKTTMQNLRASSRALPSWRWKRAVGIQFYRFQSFHFQRSHKRRRIAPDTDKQRYPDEDHPEYRSYVYSPSPWKDGNPCPCPSGEAWFFFQYPDECGTSKCLNDALPVRMSDTDESRITAWGIHIEHRYSVLVIVIPILIGIVVTIAATLWFVFWWLEKHPDDLQGATVPISLAITIVTPVISTSVCIVFFRWSI